MSVRAVSRMSGVLCRCIFVTAKNSSRKMQASRVLLLLITVAALLPAVQVAAEVEGVSAVDQSPVAREMERGPDVMLLQPPNQLSGLFSDLTCDNCPSGLQVVADNFMVSTAGAGFELDQAIIWGGYFPSNVPVATPFEVVVHGDDAGAPGPILCSDTLFPTSDVLTGVVLFGVDEHMLTFDLSPCQLVDGTYWIQIFTDTGPVTDDWFWEVGDLDGVNGIPGSAWSQTQPPAPWNLDAVTELSVELSGTIGGGGIGLVAHYPFAGNALDASGNENHPYSVTAQLTEDRFGQPNSAYRFNGGGNWIKIPDSPSLRVSHGLTIFAWIKPDTTDIGYVAGKLDNMCGGFNYDLDLYPGTLRSILKTRPYPDCAGGTNGGAAGATAVSVGVWHHIAVTWDKQTGAMVLYLDGSVDGNGSFDPPQFNHTTGDLNIGYYYGVYGYSGVIDDVRIYDRALTQQEIQYVSSISVFSDGFEVGDTSRWSAAVP